LIVVQLVIKVGDKVAEFSFSAKEKQGQQVLKAVEVSVSNSDVVVWPATRVGRALMESAGLTAPTQKTPPSS
jgi:hypothetical protein